MELNDANLQTLTEFLQKTLDPNPSIRRPGMTVCLVLCIWRTQNAKIHYMENKVSLGDRISSDN